MGSDLSAPSVECAGETGEFSYTRLDANPSGKINVRPYVSQQQKCNNKLISMEFYGLWSVVSPAAGGPCARIGHFHTYDPRTGLAYIGYGLDGDQKVLGDVWSLDLKKRVWKQIFPTGYSPAARTGASAVFYEGTIFIFGGYAAPDYFDDLHFINVDTGECGQIRSSGDIPTPRTSPLVGCYNRKLFIWGGFDRTFPTDLYRLDLDTLVWTSQQTGLGGRTTAPYTIVGSDLYSYGSSQTSALLHIEMKEGTIEEIPCIGACPPNEAQCAGMASTPETLFWFGGRTKNQFGFVYAYDIKSKWWFVYHIRPDGSTVSFYDGRVDNFGLFQMPHISSYSMQYEERTRELIGVFGNPMKNPPPLFVVSIGESIGSMHLRDDMLALLRDKKD